ncbi:DNA replication licensing factor MCM5 [Cyanidioschyzon merolae strain 10D]|jgi:DNA replication licensing factor MCM5|uniref:DNA replication licensing factor MCM5 n=1 Tax=Cyanidioschyzon merolae (strain NIES-3377 / 10D) TaxID=280699 RepID=M1V4M8_CYAM1|nr:DNA replication licensing factor MCM5 [Cyanidioschyzon merolae strain 10D]BAM79525.1 DNA replication licensing factor MCM5 [Cyanidioschyzon merolae strain 10D]|eukprot:XP_005535811.1 DNA replication licensing factor MCM5 [Cyanidioschyzon merolae strain 10D]
MDWHAAPVYYTDQGVGVPGAEEQSGNVSIQERRIIEFLLQFRSAPNVFPYRDQLVRQLHARKHWIQIKIEDVYAFDEELAGYIRQAPNEWIERLEQAVDRVVRRLRLPLDHEIGGVSVQVLLQSQENAFPLRELQSDQLGRLVRVQGIVISASKVRAKAQVVWLRCQHCDYRKMIRASVGFGGFQVPRQCDRVTEMRCPLDSYEVMPHESVFVDHQTVKLQELPESVPTGEVPRSLLLVLERNLIDRVAPGERVSAVGVYSTYASTRDRSSRSVAANIATRASGPDLVAAVRTPYIRVLGIDATQERRDRHPGFTPEEEEAMRSLSRLPNVYEVLAASIAPEIWGLSDPKRAVLCQLFGGSRKTLPDGMRIRGDINVLLLGDPSTAKSQLLKFAEKVAPVSVYTSGKGSSAAGLTASVIRDATHGEFHLEGGAMVLADGGIVCIDEFDKMRLADRVAIHEAMEQQTISIAKAGITTVLNSRTAVLAAANPLFGSFDDTRTVADQMEFASTILSRFDLIFLVRDVRNDERDRTIARHVLALHQRGHSLRPQGSGLDSAGDISDSGMLSLSPNGASEFTSSQMLNAVGLVPIDKLRRYVAYARRRCRPRLSAEAADLLRTAYVAVRQELRDRTADGPTPVPIAVRQLESLIRLTEALAKMRLSDLASAADAEEALRLFRVATMAAAHAGALPPGAFEGTLSGEFLIEVQAAEAAIRRRIAIGSMLALNRLVRELTQQHLSAAATQRAIQIMLGRQELEWRRQRTVLCRLR